MKSRLSAPVHRNSRPYRDRRQGVALVVTLILLAVITTLAIAFVALTHRETAAVAATSSTTDAELAAEAGLERAKAEILARITRDNLRNFGSSVVGPDFMVSIATDQNRLDPAGAFVDPSPPVFVNTNVAGGTGTLDERYFLDLNRNRYYDETGFVPETTDAFDNTTGRFQTATDPATGGPATNWVVGDPMWIGILSNPLRRHTNNNRFISRYAWAAFPVGRSLDINAIHNQTVGGDLNNGPSGFYRHQGLGSWEINLAGFLTDLNTNEWPAAFYDFRPLAHSLNPIVNVANGRAFDDARSVLAFRYNWDLASLDVATNYFRHTGTPAIFSVKDGLDYFNVLPVGLVDDRDSNNAPWVGSRNKRNFHTLIHDLWDPNKLPDPNGLRSRLAAASAQGNSYDRYTYYRMLSQLGTDSAPEDDSSKIHVNYVNLRSWVNPDFRLQASDMVPWNTRTTEFINQMGRTGPDLFFLTTVRKLFLQDTNFASFVSNQTSLPDRPLRIPVFTNNSRFVVRNYGGTFTTNALYSGRVHQILQQVANIYDAVRDWEPGEIPDQHAGLFPSVFRPVFEVDGNDVYIVNYKFVEPLNSPFPPDPVDSRFTGIGLMNTAVWRDLDLGEKPQSDDLVYNIPLILGARKGFPNFNEFATRTSVMGVRRLEALKAAGERDIRKFTFTETFNLYLTNDFGFEAWNSYFTNAYPRSIGIFFTNQAAIQIKRDNVVVRSFVASEGVAPPRGFFTANQWPSARVGDRSFFATNFPARELFSWTNVATVSPAGPAHRWTVSVTNRVRFFLYDAANRLVDAVSLSIGNEFLDIGRELATDWEGARGATRIWATNRVNNVNWQEGIELHLNISRGLTFLSETDWRNFGPQSQNRTDGIRSFNSFIESDTDTFARVPFVPSRVLTQTNTWRAADPLVHYTAEDLWRGSGTDRRANLAVPVLEFGKQNPEYQPWSDDLPNTKQPNVRDPGLRSPDLWSFPTNKIPTVGFLGRVHRGTPFQSIYLKSDSVGSSTWLRHNNPNRAADTSLSMAPTNDWRLLDIFTSTIHPNASRGRLSINQTNLAAWSAVLSGLVPSSITNDTIEEISVYRGASTLVNPAALAAADPGSQFVPRVVAAINRIRGNRQFGRMSDLLAVPELTSQSPLLTANGQFNPRQPAADDGVFDFDYESVPERVLGLLKVGEPRYVIYAWGQSLKPAEFGVEQQGSRFVPRGPSIETAGDRRGLVRNYQITGELATRAVVRIEFPRLSDDPRSPLYDEYDYRRPTAVVESFNVIPPQ